MSNTFNSTIALIAGPRCGSSSIINYFVKAHDYKFEYCTVPVNKPKTIYLLRDVANFDQFNSHPHQKTNSWMAEFIKLAKNDNIHTIALIRNPIEQLLSIYHKMIENGGEFEKIKMSINTSFSKLAICRRYDGIIHQSLQKCDSIIDLCETKEIHIDKIKTRMIKRLEISGNRGIEFFIRNNLISEFDFEKLENSETMKLYKNLKQ